MSWGPVAWMTGAGLAIWTAAVAGFGGAVHPEALIGVAGPLVSANVSWLVMARARAAGPDRLMAVMITAAAVKMALFGGYVALVLLAIGVRPVPFIASFTVSFIGLYALEAYFLKGLLVGADVSNS
jgi:hypothetical protein